MNLQRVRVPGAGNGLGASGRRIACTVVSMAIVPLLVGCAESGTPTTDLEVADGGGGSDDTRSMPPTSGSPNGAFTQGTEDAPAGDVGGGEAPTNEVPEGAPEPEGEANDEAEMDGVAGTRGDAETRDDTETRDDIETKDDTGDERVADVTASPEVGSGVEVPASGSPDSPSESGPAATPPDPLSLANADVLPAVQPVTGTDVKLDGVLLELIRARRTGGEAAVRAYAQQHQPGLSVERLRVEIVCDSPDAAAVVREQVAAAGGTVTTSFENYVWAELPLDEVEALVVSEAVWTIGVTQSLVQPGAR